MAFLASVVYSAATSASSVLDFKRHLKTVGWTVTGSGDGLSLFSSSGDIITSGGTGAGGLRNNRAWFALRSPDGANAFTFQNLDSTNGNSWRVKWSPGGVFNVGGSANTTPGNSLTVDATATDIIVGAGTDASPTSALLLVTLANAASVTVASDTAPYTFWFAQMAKNRHSNTGFFFDSLVSTLPGDTNPYVWVQDATQAFNDSNLEAETGTSIGHSFYNMFASPPKRLATRCWAFGYPSATSFKLRLQTDTFLYRDALTPMAFTRPSNATDGIWKGISENIYWTGVRGTTGETASVNSTRDRIYLVSLCMPWDGSVPLF